MRQLFLLAALAVFAAGAHALGDKPKVPTLEERQKAVEAQMKITAEMSKKPVEEQLKIAQEWAKKHRTAQAPATMDEASQAYAFRTRLYGDAHCQEFAQQADSAFLDGQLETQAKMQALNQIGVRAGSAGCIAAQ